ncbi:hypothetical protein P5V15_010450 [Pogonomyrmex californicus]
MIILTFSICISSIFDSMLSVKMYNNIKGILIPFVLNYCVYINTLMDIMFIILLRYIGNRMDKINDYIKQLSETKDYGIKCKWKKSFVVSYYVRNIESRKHVLWTLMHLHSELCRIARNVNNLSEIQMTLQMISYFIILIGMCNFLYYIIISFTTSYHNILINSLLTSSTWFIVFVMRLIFINYICENISAKAQNTKDIIYKLTNLTCFTEIHEEICYFVLQASLHPLKFTGLGLFYFGYGFIRKFFMWIFTIVLFMIQMEVSVVPKILIFNKYNISTRYNNSKIYI